MGECSAGTSDELDASTYAHGDEVCPCDLALIVTTMSSDTADAKVLAELSTLTPDCGYAVTATDGECPSGSTICTDSSNRSW